MLKVKKDDEDAYGQTQCQNHRVFPYTKDLHILLQQVHRDKMGELILHVLLPCM